MDRRTLLFIAISSLTLIGVNTYFERQRLEEVKQWRETHPTEQEEVVKKEEAPRPTLDEKVYVLSNPTMQIAFSTIGGAIKEINLPFKSDKHPESVVRPIAFDREMVEEDPQNAHFPATPYYTAAETPVLHEQGEKGGYYPLLRRSLITPKMTVPLDPKYYALNFSSDFPELATIPFEVTHFSDNKIVFKAITANRTITKTYWFEPYPKDGPYCFNLKMEVEGDTKGLWLTSGIPDVEWISGGPAPTLKYRQTRNGKPEVLQLDLPEKTVTMSTASPDWVCNSNGFLGLILNPLEQVVSGFKTEKVSGEDAPSRLLVIDHGLSKFEAAKLPGYQFLLPFPEKANTIHWRIFAGPFSTKVLDAVDMIYSNPETGYESDYISCQSYHGWFTFISAPFAKFLMFLMNLFYSATGSWVLSIVLLTVALRLMLYPLNAKAFESSRKMQKIGPKVKALQDKYKKDPRQGQIEVMNLYRQEGVNPFSGCFLMLVQLPFLIGMFDLLKSNFELRGASFIPGWINDLTAPDVLFSWNYWIPFIGNSFHLLPFILGGVMFFQQRLMSPLPADQNEWTDQQRQQRSMGTMMALVFTLMFYHFPAGLNIYWLSSMLLSMLQQWWSQRK